MARDCSNSLTKMLRVTCDRAHADDGLGSETTMTNHHSCHPCESIHRLGRRSASAGPPYVQSRMIRMVTRGVRAISVACFVSAMSCGPVAARGAQPMIHVGPTIRVSADESATPLAETWLATNARNPQNMIAASMAFPKDGRWASVMYRTMDGGKSWQRVSHGERHDGFFWGADPVIAFGSDGTAYYSHLEWGSLGDAPFDDEPSSHGAHANVYMYRSADGGESWSDPIALYGNDHSCIAIDESSGKYHGRVYVAYNAGLHTPQGKSYSTNALAYSDDGGRTYRQRVFVAPDGPLAERVTDGPAPTDLLVAPDGTVVLAYTQFLKPEANAPQDELIQQTWVMTSFDGGRTFGQPHLATTSTFPKVRSPKLDIRKVGYWPRMVIDASEGPNRGRLYLAYEDVADKRVRVVVVSSSDVGQTWGEPVQVNDDRTPADDNSPGLAVSANGTVGISWYDRRNDAADICYQEYFSASLDGGVTFLPNVAARARPTCPLARGNWQPNVSQYLDTSKGAYSVILSSGGPRFMNGGETQGLSGLSGGRFQLAWIDGAEGVMQLASTTMEVAAAPLGADVGDLLDVQTSRPTLDPKARKMTLEVTVTNRARRSMKAPLYLVLGRVDSVLEGLHAVNADNGLEGVGAQWRLPSPSGSDATLEPGETARPVVVEFDFAKVPESTWDALPLVAGFHIFENQP